MTAVMWRATPKNALRRLAVSAGPVGVVLGREHSGGLAAIRLLRPEPTRAVLVAGYWAAHVIAFRCLGAGAVVDITTTHPQRWMGLAQAAGQEAALRIVPAGQYAEPLPALGSTRPVLFIADVGPGRPAEQMALAPWQASLSVLPTLTSHSAPGLADADLVLLQRLLPAEADACVTALRMPADALEKLQQLHDEMIVSVIGGEPKYIFVATTAVEYEVFGPARRDRPNIA
jgi:hypothetical protein